MSAHPLWARLFLLRTELGGPRARAAGPALRAPDHRACPHCTNLDTLAPHCPDDRCGWSLCTCGAVIYGGRRHRHPRHGSGADTCHDPFAAA